MKEYNPFLGMKNRYFIADSGNQIIFRVTVPSGDSTDFLLPFESKTPKSGLFLAENIPNGDGGTILDIGTGAHAIIPLYALRFLNYRRAVGGDIDPKCIEKAEEARKYADETRLELTVSNVFNNITGHFDVIVSNPPFTPLPPGLSSNGQHDFGGHDGYTIITEVIAAARQYLTPKGKLYLVLAEYLGIEENTGNPISLFNRLRNQGFSPQRIATMGTELRPGSVTHKTLDHILSLYPGYKFKVGGHLTSDEAELLEAREKGKKMGYNLVVVRGTA